MKFEIKYGSADWGMPTQHVISAAGVDKNKDEYIVAIIPTIQPACISASKQQLDYAKRQKYIADLFMAAPRMVETLTRCLKDMDNVDKICEIAQAHSFDLMRKDIEEALEFLKEEV